MATRTTTQLCLTGPPRRWGLRPSDRRAHQAVARTSAGARKTTRALAPIEKGRPRGRAQLSGSELLDRAGALKSPEAARRSGVSPDFFAGIAAELDRAPRPAQAIALSAGCEAGSMAALLSTRGVPLSWRRTGAPLHFAGVSRVVHRLHKPVRKQPAHDLATIATTAGSTQVARGGARSWSGAGRITAGRMRISISRNHPLREARARVHPTRSGYSPNSGSVAQ